MNSSGISSSLLEFLKKLSRHNDREWFNAHKDLYLQSYEAMIGFAEVLHEKMSAHDLLETEPGKKILFRIYADTRFSKDKSPYKTYWGGRFKRATKKLRGGYYFHIEPGNSFVAGGFFGPNPDDLKRIRQDIEQNEDVWRVILKDKSFLKTFGELQGEQVTNAPKGYSADNPAIDLLRYKQFILKHPFNNKEVLSATFADKVNDTFKQMRPFLDHMSEVLTTDLNGVSII
jgi:uncharacterized protein (TIGR02453 family)